MDDTVSGLWKRCEKLEAENELYRHMAVINQDERDALQKRIDELEQQTIQYHHKKEDELQRKLNIAVEALEKIALMEYTGGAAFIAQKSLGKLEAL